MGILGFLFCWFFVGAVTVILGMWLARDEADVPFKAVIIITCLGFLSPIIVAFAAIAHTLENNSEFKNPFYKEPKKEKEDE